MSWPRITFVGLLMGAAEIVPGVSGGTIAFVSGYYQRLLSAIAACTPRALVDLFREGVKPVWQRVDGAFLLTLFGAMAVAVFTLARLITYLLEAWPVPLWAFFFGLVLASIMVVTSRLQVTTRQILLPLASGTVFGFVITRLFLLELEASPSPLVLFLGGSIAVCAWVLPGISGSFILLMLGLYPAVLHAVTQVDFLSLLSLGAGCVLGLLLFVRLVSHLLARYQRGTLAFLVGFMLVSLFKVWPWRVKQRYQMLEDGGTLPVQYFSVWPWDYLSHTGGEPQVLLALVAMLAGFALIVALEAYRRKGAQHGPQPLL